jgi:transposase
MFVGLDIHKNSCVATQMDERGKIVRREKIGTSKEEIEEFFSSIEKGKVVMESTGIWEYIYEIIDGLGFDVTLSNPVKTRIIAETLKLPHLLVPYPYRGDKICSEQMG